jgi:hypothetical protein
LFKRPNATATSETSAISTNPNPRQSPETRSVTARALRAPVKNSPEDHGW